MRARLATTLLFAAVLTGCAAAPDTPVALTPTRVPGAATVQVADPVSITIPALAVTDRVVPVGLAADGSMEIPDVHDVGWYQPGPEPGEQGSSVIVGHVDYDGVRGIFHDLGHLKPGDTITVTDVDGTTRTFAVDAVANIPKVDFAARTSTLVFGPVNTAELRLVTCSGRVVNHSYLSNTIVSARLVTS